METKESILYGAEELFMRFGIRSISMDDIAGHMSISKKTVYKFYKDKSEMVHRLMKQTLDENCIIFSEIQRESKNVVEELFRYMKQMHEIFSKRNPVLFYDLQKYYPHTWKLFNDFKREFISNMVEKSLRKGIADGFVRPKINVKILTRLRIEEIEMGFNQLVFPPNKFNMLETQLEMADHFLYGICTLKGYKLIEKHKRIINS